MNEIIYISCDEAAHTGPDLLNLEQRVFAFSSVAIKDDEAFEIIAKARSRFAVALCPASAPMEQIMRFS